MGPVDDRRSDRAAARAAAPIVPGLVADGSLTPGGSRGI